MYMPVVARVDPRLSLLSRLSIFILCCYDRQGSCGVDIVDTCYDGLISNTQPQPQILTLASYCAFHCVCMRTHR